MSGVCYGVSVGPGEAGLISVKAVDIINKADIVFLPSFPKEKCKAYLAVKESLPTIDEKDLRCETFSMSRDASVMMKRHEEIFTNVCRALDDGRTVAFLTLGEVGIYSTYLYIHEKLIRNGYDSRLISGISSFCEIADRLKVPIALGDEEIHIFPDMGNLAERLKFSGTKIFMKPKGKLYDIIDVIKAYAAEHIHMSACGISNCGMENEIIADNMDELDKLDGYFTVIFVFDRSCDF